MSRRGDLGGLGPQLLGRPEGDGDRDRDRSRWRAGLARLRDAFVDNAALKFVALVLSLTVFILVHSDETAVAGATVAVSYTLPPGKVLVSEPVEELRLTVKGTRRRVRRFDPADLDRVNLDLRAHTEGELVFDRDMIGGLPDGLELVSIAPASIHVALADRVERLVPVVVETSGAPARGFRVARLEAVPAQVAVVGTAESLADLASIRTAPVAIGGQRSDLIEEVALVPVEGARLEGAARVRVEVGFAEEQGVRQLGSLTVAVRPGAGVAAAAASQLEVEPAAVEVVLRGGVLNLENVAPGAFEAFVEVSAADLAGGGKRRTAEVRIAPALAGIGIEVRPPTVALRAKK